MDINYEIDLPLPAEQAWERFVHGGVLQRWLGADRLDIDLFKEGTFRMELVMEGDNIQVVGETALLVPPEKFGMTWMEQQRGRDLWSAPTRLLFDLVETAGGSRLAITQEGFEAIGDEHQSAAFERYQIYWRDESKAEALKEKLSSTTID